jgi:hypothetical protein
MKICLFCKDHLIHELPVLPVNLDNFKEISSKIQWMVVRFGYLFRMDWLFVYCSLCLFFLLHSDCLKMDDNIIVTN